MIAQLQDLSPQDVQVALAAGAITLIDVREPREFAAERIPGALNFPLSTFEPAAVPHHPDRPVVFHCQAGRRSEKAAALAREAGAGGDRHLAGGLNAWKQAGLSLILIDPETGEARRTP